MLLSFELTMPNKASWDGKWSGEDRPYFIVRAFRSHDAVAKAALAADKGYFHYSWSDGWGAGVKVKEVESAEAQKLRKKSAGFCGYDWMVDSIIKHGEIRAD